MKIVKNTLLVLATLAVVGFVLLGAGTMIGTYQLRKEGYVHSQFDGQWYKPGTPAWATACRLGKCD